MKKTKTTDKTKRLSTVENQFKNRSNEPVGFMNREPKRTGRPANPRQSSNNGVINESVR